MNQDQLATYELFVHDLYYPRCDVGPSEAAAEAKEFLVREASANKTLKQHQTQTREHTVCPQMPPHSGMSSGSSSTSVTIAPVSSFTMQVPRPVGPPCVREK